MKAINYLKTFYANNYHYVGFWVVLIYIAMFFVELAIGCGFAEWCTTVGYVVAWLLIWDLERRVHQRDEALSEYGHVSQHNLQLMIDDNEAWAEAYHQKDFTHKTSFYTGRAQALKELYRQMYNTEERAYPLSKNDFDNIVTKKLNYIRMSYENYAATL